MITMSILSLIGYIAGAFGLIAVVAAALVVTRSATSKQTIDSQKDLIDTLIKGKDEQKEQIADLLGKHIESTKAIAGLQGQVDVLKNIPLKEISGDLASISEGMQSLSKNQGEIVVLLKANGFKPKST
jgi:hypothetical protein